LSTPRVASRMQTLRESGSAASRRPASCSTSPPRHDPLLAAPTMTFPNRFTPTNAIEALPRLRGRTPMAPSALLLSLIVPVYNERATIELILDQVHAVPVRKEIICVDDFSTDGTRELLQRMKDSGRI